MKLTNAAGIIACAAALMFAPLNQQANAQCLADVNHDNYVNGSDLTAILSTWGTDGGSAGGDINGDGTVSGLDLAFVLSGWGICPGPTWATVLEWTPDPAVVTDTTLRNAITASGLPWRVRDNSSNIEMLLVPAGSFTMGASPGDQEAIFYESPPHLVSLTNPFYLSKTEVTQAQYKFTIGSNPSYFQGAQCVFAGGDCSNNPVETISLSNVSSFCIMTGLRLPSEAEWEFACRAGTTTARYGDLDDIAWYSSNSIGTTHNVGDKLPNALGFYDMIGNVWEMTQDLYGAYSSSPAMNPTGPTIGNCRVLRSCGWSGPADQCRSSFRLEIPFTYKNSNLGFRVARTSDLFANTITSITPSTGSTLGGNLITIVGTDLSDAISVSVDSVPATNMQIVSPTMVTAVTPVGTVGAKNVSVITTNGTATATNAFTYVAPPTISSVSPISGGVNGGTSITITGTNFTGATTVKVGGLATANLVVVSSSSITTIAPGGTVGAKSVVVTTPGGTATAENAFTYVVQPASWYTVLEQVVNPAVVTNSTLRNAIIASGLPWRVQDNGTGIEMLLVPAGTFAMGCSPGDTECWAEESPVHQVTLTEAFYVGKTEVTQAQWLARMGSNPSYFDWFPDSPSRPVEYVSWTMVQTFCGATGLRLPTEAEWEYACRAGTTTARYGILNDIAWWGACCGGNGDYFSNAVGGKAANPLGLYDTIGNVWEYCQDVYGPYSSASVTNPTGPTSGSSRIIRGGDFSGYITGGNCGVVNCGSGECRASGYRLAVGLSDYNQLQGFRVVRSANSTVSIPVTPDRGTTSGGTPITIMWSGGTSASVKVGGAWATNVQVTSGYITAKTPLGTVGIKDIIVYYSGGFTTLANAFTYVVPVEWYIVLEQLPNPAVVTDASLRSAITATGLPWRVQDNGSGIEMLLVPPGTFMMGASPGDFQAYTSECPSHQVTLSSAFYLGRYEVTQAQWTAKMGSNPSDFQPPSYTLDPKRPVEDVSWNMVASAGGFMSVTGLRLPTEAEWEFACRAGTTTARYGVLNDIAWYSTNAGGTPHTVGGKLPNALGIYDMLGNVFEICQDWHSETYYTAASVTNPTGPTTGTTRSIRGGDFYQSYGDFTHWHRGSGIRYGRDPYFSNGILGFRVAKTPYGPTISSVSPNSGLLAGGTSITITGTYLTGATSVTVGGVDATSVVVVSATSITAVTPAGTVGAKSVAVTTAYGTATATNAFTYFAPPTISSVSPVTGSTAGGTAITITGTNLTGATSVTVGGVTTSSVVVVSSTSITAVTPAGTVGAKSVAVTTPGGSATATNAFTYFAPPTISSVSPVTGSTAGGTAITITGTSLTGATSVTVGGVAATSVVVVSATSITAVTPAGTVGAKSVAVTTAYGTATATNAFTYVVPNGWYIVLEQAPNAAVVTNVTLRNAITASGLPWRVQDTSSNIEMLLVPAGTFTMGCSGSTQYACSSDENPTHQVILTQAFYMGRYEVTQAQWQAKMGSNPSTFQGASYPDAANRPVERVSWNTIQNFNIATGLRLPTEAEWEYAYRAGTTTAFHSYAAQPTGFNDDTLLGNIAWYSGNNSPSGTKPVGGKLANGLGLHDMAGNVWEWCQDWYDSTYYGSSPLTNPTGPTTGSVRLLRGGYWFNASHDCRASQRLNSTPDVIYYAYGFRVVRTP